MNRLLPAAVVFLASAALLFAQTKPTIDQVKAPASPGAPVTLIGVLASGKLVQVKLSGFVVTTDPAGNVTLAIDAAALPSSTSRVYNETPTVSPLNGDVWGLANRPIAGTEEVHVNGIRQKPGLDYDLNLQTVTFRKVCSDLTNQPISCIGTAPTVVVSYSK